MVCRWLAIRLEIMAAFIVFLTAIFCVMSTEIDYLKTHITSSLVGLAISYALNVSCLLALILTIPMTSDDDVNVNTAVGYFV